MPDEEPGEPLEDFLGENLDGEPFAGENLDGEALAGENVDGEAFAGENSFTGENLDDEALGENFDVFTVEPVPPLLGVKVAPRQKDSEIH